MKAAGIALRLSAAFLCAAAGVLLLVVLFQVRQIPAAFAARVDPLLSEVRATNQKTQDLVTDIKDSLNNSYFDYLASVDSAAAASRSTAELVEDLRANLMGGKDTRGNLRAGILPGVEDAVAQFSHTTASLEADLHRLSNSTDDALKPLGKTLANLAALSETLDAQVKEASPKANQTLASLNRSIDDLDKILADPNIQINGVNAMQGDMHKVNAGHLKRNAYLYIRQSTPRQVLENTKSAKRQYALRQRALALGWHPDRIVVIDGDQGQSGSSATDREGFQKLVAEVGMGHAGLVIGLEVSRLARNCSDWHRLLEICGFSDTLILDEDGLYNPADFNDRLLLGLNRPDTQSTSYSTFR